MPHVKQVGELAVAAKSFADAHGASLSEALEKESRLVLYWLSYLNQYQRTGVADQLLDGVASAVREGAACLAMGLVRPTILSFRTEIDLVLCWLFFKDHKIEWDRINATGEGYKLKKEIFDYLNTHFSGFNARFNLLQSISSKPDQDAYRLLSAHIHNQSTAVVVSAAELKNVVRSEKLCREAVALRRLVSEYINDVMLSVFAPQWNALPKKISDAAVARFSSAPQKKKFFEGV